MDNGRHDGPVAQGPPAHLTALGKALPCKGNRDSRVQKLRRWVSNANITPEHSIAARLALLAPFLVKLPELTLIIDRTEWTRLGVHVNLFLCSVAFHGRSFPISWTLLPKRGCSCLKEQQALLSPVLLALAAQPLLAYRPITVVADREFSSPTLAKWLKSLGIHFCLRVKKSYRVSRPDIPSIPIRAFFAPCQPGISYLFEDVLFTEEHQFRCHLFLLWREDCQEPLVLITDQEDTTRIARSYHDRMFIETLNRDLKSSGYDIERGKMTDLKRLEHLLIPIAFAYTLSVIQGHIEERIQPVTPEKKRIHSLFTKARDRMIDLLERTPLSSILQFFSQFFQFLHRLLRQTCVENFTNICQTYAKQQSLLLGGIP